MSVSLKHSFASAKSDGGDATLVQPSDWNAEHALSIANARLLGNTTGSAGIEEISVGSGLTLSSGTLSQSAISSVTLDNTGLQVKDTNASHNLTIAPGSDLTANRTLTLTTGNANRTLDISAGNVTISSAGAALIDDASTSDQRTTLGLGTSNSPQFTGIELGHASDTTITRVGAGRIAVEGAELAPLASPTFSGVITIPAGSASAPPISPTGDSNTGIYFPAADAVALATGGTHRWRCAGSNMFFVKTAASKTTQGIEITGGLNFDCVRNPGNDTVNFWNASSGSLVGQIVVNASSTSYVTTSDYRLKTNVQPMENALTRLMKLNPVRFNWVADNEPAEGFIAHELQAHFPQCVTGEKDAKADDGSPKYQGVDAGFLVAVLVKAIQELKAEFDAYVAADH